MELNFLPAKVRGIAYAVAVVVGLLTEAATKGFEALHQALPAWLVFMNAALPTLLAALGAVALSHLGTPTTSSDTEVPVDSEPTDGSDELPDADIETETEDAPSWGLPDNKAVAPATTPVTSTSSAVPTWGLPETPKVADPESEELPEVEDGPEQP